MGSSWASGGACDPVFVLLGHVSSSAGARLLCFVLFNFTRMQDAICAVDDISLSFVELAWLGSTT
jgi:hypothetical protein